MADVTLSKETARESPRVVAVAVGGQVGHDNVQTVENYLDDVLHNDKPRHVLLDLGGFLFGDSSFLALLIILREKVRGGGGQMVLYGLRPEITSLLRVVSFDRVLTIKADRAAALEALPKE